MAKKAAPYFRFFASDWLSSTRGLNATEAGILINLRAMMHEREGPIPEDGRLQRRVGCAHRSTFERALSELISNGLIVRKEAGLWSDELDEEIEHRAEKSSSAKSASKKRWEKSKQKQSKGSANAMLYQSQKSESERDALTERHAKRSTINGDARATLDAGENSDARPSVASPDVLDVSDMPPIDPDDEGAVWYDGPEEGDEPCP